MKEVLKFMFLIEPTIESFPNKKDQFYGALEEICVSVPELIFEFGDPIYIQYIMKILLNLFQKNMEDIVSNVDTKNLYEDSSLNMIHTITLKLGSFMYEEMLLDATSPIGQKCVACKDM